MTTTTAPVSVVCSGASLITMTVTAVPISVGQMTWGQQDLVLPPQLIPWDTLRGSAGPVCATETTILVPDAFSGICQPCHGSSTGKFLFQSWVSKWFLYHVFGVCYGVCLLLSGSHVAAMFIYRGSTIGFCTTTTLWSLPLAGICASWWWSVTMPGVHWVATFPTASSWGEVPAAYLTVPQPF